PAGTAPDVLLRAGRPASDGDSASRAWSDGSVSCGRGSPGRGGRNSALGGMVNGECETILNSSGENFLAPPRLSNMLHPPRAKAASAMKVTGLRLICRIVGSM